MPSDVFTSNLGLDNPTPLDPATTNIWGTSENNGRSLLDIAVGGTLTLSVAGSSNVVLAATPLGVPSASLYANFIFTGVLTGNIIVFWPQNMGRTFSVTNNTTGAFTLTLAVNNGSGAAAGGTQAIAQATATSFFSDGTNINLRNTSSGGGGGGAVGGDLSGTLPNPQVVNTHLSAPLPVLQGGTGASTQAGAQTALGLGALALLGVGTGLASAGGNLSFAAIAARYLLANNTGSTAIPTAVTLTALLDGVFGTTQGSVLYRGASAWASLGPGTSGYVLKTSGAGANPSWTSNTGITTGTLNTMNPWTVNSTSTQAHGLSRIPDLVVTYYQCLTAEYGYNVGDRIYLSAQAYYVNGGSSAFGQTTSCDASNTYISTDSLDGGFLNSRSNHTGQILTPANWKIVATPYLLS